MIEILNARLKVSLKHGSNSRKNSNKRSEHERAELEEIIRMDL